MYIIAHVDRRKLVAGGKRRHNLLDIGLAVAYVAYAFVFNLAYDKIFPITQPVGESR